MRKVLFIAAVIFGLLPASVAMAHDPIILTTDQLTPSAGPLILDGTISFALYGSLDAQGDTRGFRVNFKAGDTLYISLLIPDLPPENELEDTSLPYLNVQDPNGATIKLSLTEKIPFPEPFTGTNYVRLTESSGIALSGTYSITIMGDAPSRFTVSIGQKEMFGSLVENLSNRDLGVAGVMEWYSATPSTMPATTLPPTAVPPTTLPPTAVPPTTQTLTAELPGEQTANLPGDQTKGDSSSNTLIIVIAVILVLAIGFGRVIISRRTKA